MLQAQLRAAQESVSQRDVAIRGLRANLDEMHARLLAGEAQLKQELAQRDGELLTAKARMQQLAPLLQRIAARGGGA